MSSAFAFRLKVVSLRAEYKSNENDAPTLKIPRLDGDPVNGSNYGGLCAPHQSI